MYLLLDRDRRPVTSPVPGTLGGHRRSRVFGRLDCPAAARALAAGGYVRDRVFFADRATALLAGYRPCGACLRAEHAAWRAGEVAVRVEARGPFAHRELHAFLAARAIEGVEEVGPETYARRLPGGTRIEARLDAQGAVITVRFTDPRAVPGALRAAVAILDLDTDAAAVDAHLARDPRLAPLVAARPGLRAARVPDAWEAAVRAIVGQQISVAGARTVLARLVATLGEGAFPTRAQVAAAPGEAFPMPRARAAALRSLAASSVDPRDRASFLAQRGIGPWTADYVALRTGDADVLLATDLVARRVLERLGARSTDAWSPYRTYATHHLWAAASAS